MKSLNEDQKTRLKTALENEPSLHNARFYINHPLHRDHSLLTMSCWLNEVAGKPVSDPAVVADVLGVPPPGSPPEVAKPEPVEDTWKDQRAALGDILA